MTLRTLCLLVFALLASPVLASGVYQTTEDFLGEAFAGDPPAPAVLWLKGEVKQTAEDILGHRYRGLRVRYWLKDNRSAWILEEIGKEKPITTGLVIDNDRLDTIRVLEFRESRGWEVRYPFFTDQFTGVGLTGDRKLDGRIDGISGATLSVRALKKLARLALYFHTQVTDDNDTTP